MPEPLALASPAASPSSLLAELATALEHDGVTGEWTPTALERSLARRLVIGSAGDLQLTPGLLRSALWEGSVALAHENGGRFGSLLALSFSVAESSEADRDDVLTRVRKVMERVHSMEWDTA
ncbi:hypothetical protein Shyhy01_20530 [Streptomyces hygroscopicus subsp. hygroscopicus]|uniref:hypothetical protein n=1 Tax=Streptomyces sp. KHY 26 TaxID=3097359 RepID=UPI0024A40D04|nr:hypothetical protein [Streptomyces hygroscopicus]GLX49103.1 hypothetical protein Shyhy01_20530 [Streptomyces hygroscopicus subsp. hygroscopicus]